MKKILITGITGQDGIFLTSSILKNEKNTIVYGITRLKDNSRFYKNIETLNNIEFKNLKLLNIDLLDKSKVFSLLSENKFDNIYNLSGPSSVYQSIQKPEETKNQIKTVFNNLTNSLLELEYFPNFFQASSSEMFSNEVKNPIDEGALMLANSPYAEAKLYNHKKVIDYSKSYDWNIVSGIMFNHESEFRKRDYLINKIIMFAKNTTKHSNEKLELGSLEYVRDWTFAGDVVEAAINLIDNNLKGSYVIGSGVGNKIRAMVEIIFDYFNLNYESYIEINEDLLRTGDPIIKISNPKKIYNDCGWKHQMSFEDMVVRCIRKNRYITN